MAQLPTYQAKERVSGGTYVRASGGEFGSGEGLIQASKGIAEAADMIQQVQTKEDEIWAEDAYTRAQMHWIDRLGKNKISLSDQRSKNAAEAAQAGVPSTIEDEDGNTVSYVGQGSAKKINDEFVGMAQTYLNAAPSERAKLMLSQKLGKLRVNVFSHAMAAEVGSKKAGDAKKNQDTFLSHLLAAQQGLATPEESIQGIKERLNAVAPESKFSTSDELRNTYLDADEKIYRINANEVGLRMDSEGATPSVLEDANLMSMKALETTRKYFRSPNPSNFQFSKNDYDLVKDQVIPYVEKYGKMPEGWTEPQYYLLAGLGAKDENSKIGRADLAMQNIIEARKTFFYKSQLGQLPTYEWGNFISKISDTDQQKKLLEFQKDATENISKGNGADFALLTNPKLSTAWQQAQSLPDDQRYGVIQKLMGATMDTQIAVGISRDSVKVLPMSERSRILDDVLNRTPSDAEKLNKLAKYQQQYGIYGAQVMKELVNADPNDALDGKMAAFMSKHGEPDVDLDAGFYNEVMKKGEKDVYSTLNEALKTKYGATDKDLQLVNMKNFKFADSSLQKLFNSIQQGGSSQPLEFVEGVKNAAIARAARLTAAGQGNFSKNIKDAIQFYVDDTYGFANTNDRTMAIPRMLNGKQLSDSDISGIQNVAEQARKDLVKIDDFARLKEKFTGSWSQWFSNASYLSNFIPVQLAPPIVSAVAKPVAQMLADSKEAQASEEMKQKFVSVDNKVGSAVFGVSKMKDSDWEKFGRMIRQNSYWASDGKDLYLMYAEGQRRFPMMEDVKNENGVLTGIKPIKMSIQDALQKSNEQRAKFWRELPVNSLFIAK